MKEITLNIDGKEIKATVSEEEIEKLTKKEWPQEGDEYWYVGDVYVRTNHWKNFPFDTKQLEIGNCYRTKEEALDAVRAQKLIADVARRRKELNGDWKPVDEDEDFDGYCIVYYEGSYITFNSAYLNVTGAPFGIYKDIKCAETIIEEFKDDLLWYFTEYIVSVN